MSCSHRHFTLILSVLATAASLVLSGCSIVNKTAKNFSQEELWLKKGKQNIYGVLYRPEGIKKAPLLIVSHGIGSNHRSGAPYAEAFAKLGYAVYCYDFCGGGRASKSDGKTSDMSIFTEEKDLEAVVNGLRKVKGIKKGKVTLLGISQGGMVSALYAFE